MKAPRIVRAIAIVLLAVGAAGSTSQAARAQAPHDGIQFERGYGGAVFMMNADGSAQHQSPLPSYGYWSPDGRWVAFTGAEGVQHTPAFVARADGHDRRRIANLWTSENCFAPDWSPSGSELVYLAGCDNDATALFVVDRDGRHRRALGSKMWTLSAKWSPGGKFILFAARPAPPRFGRYMLFLAPSHRGKLRRLSGIRFDFLYGVGWAWSPDSKRIYLLAETRASNRGLELSVIGRRGGRLTTLTPPDLNVGDFDISPDGRHIALQAAQGTRAWEIYVMRSDGTGLEQLTHNRAHDRSPRWSRDGRQILFESQRDGNFEIYVMRSDGRNEKRLTRNPADDFSATWVPQP